MKLSVSLPEEDTATLDEYVHSAGLPSRSAAIRQVIRILRRSDLESDYAAAWADWEFSADQTAWDGTAADGLTDAAR